MKKIILLLAIAAALWQPAKAQTAPDLDIVWQKEIPGLDVQFAKFSKDGQFLYLAVGTNIKKMSVKSGEIVSTLSNPINYEANDMNISGTGNYLVVNSGAGSAFVYDLNTDILIKEISSKTLPTITNTYTSDISPDGSLLYIGIYAQGGYYILIYNIIQDKEITRFKVDGQIRKIKLSHNGRFLVTGTYYEDKFTKKAKNKLILWETETWQQISVLEDVDGSGEGYKHIKFSPDDRYLGSIRMLPYDLHIIELETRNLIRSSDPKGQCFMVEFLPNNQNYLQTIYTTEKGLLLELHSLNSKVREYNIRAGVIETFDSNGTWKIFCSNQKYNALLSNNVTFVNETNPDNNIQMFYETEKIIIKAYGNVLFPLNITIYDITGNTVYYEEQTNLVPNSSIELNINLPSGLYIAKAVAGGKEYIYKLNIIR